VVDWLSKAGLIMLDFGFSTVFPLMAFAMGFLAAALVALALLPSVQRRSERLALRRLEAGTPLSMKEIQADRDGIRAGFAAATHDLESKIEALKKMVTAHAGNLQSKNAVVTQLKLALDEKTELVRSMQAREGAFAVRENELIEVVLELREKLREQTDNLAVMRLEAADAPPNMPRPRPIVLPEYEDSPPLNGR
jgi:chromosome segregation ATPase